MFRRIHLSAVRSPVPHLPIPTFAHTRGVVDFIRWSSSSRRRHRTMACMAANPIIRPRSKRAHTPQAMVLSQLKTSQQNRATAFESRQVTAKRFVGPQNLPDLLMGCSGLCPLDPINLNISTERAQGQLLSSWPKSGALHTNNPRYSLFAHPCGSSNEQAYW